MIIIKIRMKDKLPAMSILQLADKLVRIIQTNSMMYNLSVKIRITMPKQIWNNSSYLFTFTDSATEIANTLARPINSLNELSNLRAFE